MSAVLSRTTDDGHFVLEDKDLRRDKGQLHIMGQTDVSISFTDDLQSRVQLGLQWSDDRGDWSSRWMSVGEELTWTLSETEDLRHSGLTDNRVFNAINVHTSFIGQVEEEVVGLERFFSLLFVAKDQVDPVMKIETDEFRLKSLAVNPHKVVCS